MAESPCVLSLALFRSRGYVAGKTEHWNQYARIRQDLFGIVDIAAFCPRRRLSVFCQTTTRDHLPDHEAKVRASRPFWWWVQTDGIFTLHGWAKRGAAGRRKVWEVIEVEYFSVMDADGHLCIIRSETGRKHDDEDSTCIVEVPPEFRDLPAVVGEDDDTDGTMGHWAREAENAIPISKMERRN